MLLPDGLPLPPYAPPGHGLERRMNTFNWNFRNKATTNRFEPCPYQTNFNFSEEQLFNTQCFATFAGKEISRASAPTFRVCAERCASSHNPRCEAMQYQIDFDCVLLANVPNHATTQSRTASSALALFPDPGPTSNAARLGPTISNLGVKFENHPGHDVDGNDLDVQFRMSFQACLGACAVNKACGGISFEAKQQFGFKNCYLKAPPFQNGQLKETPGWDSAIVLRPPEASPQDPPAVTADSPSPPPPPENTNNVSPPPDAATTATTSTTSVPDTAPSPPPPATTMTPTTSTTTAPETPPATTPGIPRPFLPLPLPSPPPSPPPVTTGSPAPTAPGAIGTPSPPAPTISSLPVTTVITTVATTLSNAPTTKTETIIVPAATLGSQANNTGNPITTANISARIAAPIVGGSAGLAIFALLIVFLFKRRQKEALHLRLPPPRGSGMGSQRGSRHSFSHEKSTAMEGMGDDDDYDTDGYHIDAPTKVLTLADVRRPVATREKDRYDNLLAEERPLPVKEAKSSSSKNIIKVGISTTVSPTGGGDESPVLPAIPEWAADPPRPPLARRATGRPRGNASARRNADGGELGTAPGAVTRDSSAYKSRHSGLQSILIGYLPGMLDESESDSDRGRREHRPNLV